ncbi:MAG: hypothetical protein SP1CHLAM54_17820 [Chlamydiia bacterium]|nr:hypothetical protein [Chlamydiia bacterium]MCH9616670.1 hypothetical protein [Chlamydiia bacterium]MCH9629402.1 hypothetical protein [Chlamydiia bacterium]
MAAPTVNVTSSKLSFSSVDVIEQKPNIKVGDKTLEVRVLTVDFGNHKQMTFTAYGKMQRVLESIQVFGEKYRTKTASEFQQKMDRLKGSTFRMSRSHPQREKSLKVSFYQHDGRLLKTAKKGYKIDPALQETLRKLAKSIAGRSLSQPHMEARRHRSPFQPIPAVEQGSQVKGSPQGGDLSWENGVPNTRVPEVRGDNANQSLHIEGDLVDSRNPREIVEGGGGSGGQGSDTSIPEEMINALNDWGSASTQEPRSPLNTSEYEVDVSKLYFSDISSNSSEGGSVFTGYNDPSPTHEPLVPSPSPIPEVSYAKQLQKLEDGDLNCSEDKEGCPEMFSKDFNARAMYQQAGKAAVKKWLEEHSPDTGFAKE